MTSVPTMPAVAPLLEDFSLEMTGKDVGKLEEARDTIPRGTRINVTFLDNEDLPMRLVADLQHRGADVERTVLSRAVQWHSEDRVIRSGNHTIVFA